MDLLSQVAGATSWKHLWIRYPLLADPDSLQGYLCHIAANHDEARHAPVSGYITESYSSPTKGPSARFPLGSVELTVALGEYSQVGQTATLIRSIMHVLFAPWISSGVMRLIIDESPLPRWVDAPGVDLMIRFL